MNEKYEKAHETLYKTFCKCQKEWLSNYVNVSNWKVHTSTMLEYFGSTSFSAAHQSIIVAYLKRRHGYVYSRYWDRFACATDMTIQASISQSLFGLCFLQVPKENKIYQHNVVHQSLGSSLWIRCIEET